MTFIAADPEVTEDNDLTLQLQQRANGKITEQVFGLEPYIILRPTFAEDTGAFQVNIEAGGGAELGSVGDFLEIVAEALQSEATQEGIARAIAAKAASDE